MPGEATAAQRLPADCGAGRLNSLMVGGWWLMATKRELFALLLVMASLQGVFSAA